MKTKIIVYVLFVTLTSCSSQVVKDNDNVLLGDKVIVNDLVVLENNENPEEWLEGMEREKLFSSLLNEVLENNKKVFSTNTPFPDYNSVMSHEEIMNILQWSDGEKNYDKLKEILFTEEWTLSSDFERFTKRVNYYCPILVYYRNGTQELLKAKTFFVKPSSNKKGKQVAKSIFQEFNLDLAIYPDYTGLDHRKLINTVFDAIEQESLKAYDPIYLVDKSKVSFTIAEVEEYIGESLDSQNLRNEVLSIITEEDWFFDAKSMNIHKEVKSLGFVKKYFEDGQHKSKILFFIMFD